MIDESTGFVAQRVLAMVINLGCDIAQQNIATVDDINAAVRLGLGYPYYQSNGVTYSVQTKFY